MIQAQNNLKIINDIILQDMRDKNAIYLSLGRAVECIKKLTPKEKAILYCLMQGKHPKKIMDELHITRSTLNYHRNNILSKTASKSLCQAVCNFTFAFLLQK